MAWCRHWQWSWPCFVVSVEPLGVLRTDCSEETTLALHVPTSSWAAKLLSYWHHYTYFYGLMQASAGMVLNASMLTPRMSCEWMCWLIQMRWMRSTTTNFAQHFWNMAHVPSVGICAAYLLLLVTPFPFVVSIVNLWQLLSTHGCYWWPKTMFDAWCQSTQYMYGQFIQTPHICHSVMLHSLATDSHLMTWQALHTCNLSISKPGFALHTAHAMRSRCWVSEHSASKSSTVCLNDAVHQEQPAKAVLSILVCQSCNCWQCKAELSNTEK